MAFQVGQTVYARMGGLGDTIDWVEAVVLESDAKTVVFVYLLIEGEAVLSVGNQKLGIGQGSRERVKERVPLGLKVRGSLLPLKQILRAFYQTELESYVSASELETDPEKAALEKRVAELDSLIRGQTAGTQQDALPPPPQEAPPARQSMAASSSAPRSAWAAEPEYEDIEEEGDDLEELIRRFESRPRQRAAAGKGGGFLSRGASSAGAEPQGRGRGALSRRGLSSAVDSSGLPAGSSGGPAPAAANTRRENMRMMLDMALLKQLTKGEDDDDDDEDDLIFKANGEKRGLAKTLGAYHRMKNRVKTHPDLIIARYVQKLREIMGASADQPWTMLDLNRKISWGKFRSLQRMHYVIACIFEALDDGRVLEAQALAAQLMKCFHQVSIDQGSWEDANLPPRPSEARAIRRRGGRAGDHQLLPEGLVRGGTEDQEEPTGRGPGGDRRRRPEGRPQGKRQRRVRHQASTPTHPAELAAGRGLHEFIAKLVADDWSTLLSRFGATLRVATLTTRPAASYRTEEEGSGMFPVRLPYPEVCNSRESPPSSRRRSSRLMTRTHAKMWVNACFSAFSFWEAGSPTKPADIKKKAARAAAKPLDSAHMRYASNLLEDVLSICRLQARSASGRGIKRLEEELAALSASSYEGLCAERLTKIAKPVVVDRLAVPERAGACDPAAFYNDDHKKVYENLAEHVVPDSEPAAGLPRACHMLPPDQEKTVLDQMLRSGLLVLRRADSILVDSDGNPILCGVFSVDHKELLDRLICDWRP